MPVSAIIGTVAGIGGSLGGAAIASHGATKAAQTQADAANHAADLQYQEFQDQQKQLAPWVDAGKVGLGQLMSGTADGSLFQPYGKTFTAPTEDQARNTPGYQFAKDEGDKSILRGATAAGGAFTGGTLKALDKYGTGLADSTYNDTFNRAQQEFNTNFNVAQTDQANKFNRLASIAGVGQTATSQLNQAGQNYATNAGNLLTSGAAASAAGTVGSSNAWGGALANGGNSATQYLLLSKLMGSGLGGGGVAGIPGGMPSVPSDMMDEITGGIEGLG